MKKIDIITIIILLILLALLSIIVTVEQEITSTSSCKQCHSVNHQSIMNASIVKHDFSCADCHVGSGFNRIESENALLLKNVKLALENYSKMNSTYQINHTSLRIQCIECHEDEDGINSSGIPEGKHRNWTCSTCHKGDMQPVQCTNCHSLHNENINWTYQTCLICHESPHIPSKTPDSYVGIPKELCAACHETQYNKLTGKHSIKNCTDCHPRHGVKERCISCHPKHQGPHRAICNACHFGGGTPIRCPDCHNPHAPKENLRLGTNNAEFVQYAAEMLAKRE